ncbi:hypothetical protein ACFOLF_06940 [Paenibacillus sepulcri]
MKSGSAQQINPRSPRTNEGYDMTSRIVAVFQDGSRTREAQLKLQALRVTEVEGEADGSMLTAMVEDDLVDRALYLIRQTGGTTEL